MNALRSHQMINSLTNAAVRFRHSDSRKAWLVDRALTALGERTGVMVAGPGRGLRLNPGGFPGYWLGLHEKELLDRVRQMVRPGETFFDIGAFIGVYALVAAREAGGCGHVVAFEPDPAAAAAIETSARANHFRHFEVVNAAVANESGSIHLSRERGSHLRIALADVEGDDESSVSAVAIDDYVDTRDLVPDVIKIDVEGAEMLVLKGMTTILTNHAPRILIETHGTLDEVRSFLATLGYSVAVLPDGYHLVAEKQPG